jgi:3-hydroxyacyl-[acyl-carrier-protein] dehydratase
MLKDNFYKILQRQGPEEEATPSGIIALKYSFLLSAERSHQVYDGHFPGNPVTPGVFQIRIIHELAEVITGKPLRMTHADNIKYPSQMIPALHEKIKCDLILKRNDDERISVSAGITAGDTTFIKFKGTFEADGI